MIEKLILGPILLATIVALYVLGIFYIPTYLAGVRLFVPSFLTYILFIAACLLFVHYRERLYAHLDDGPVSYKLQGIDKIEKHPFINILLLNIFACLFLFFAIIHVTKITGVPYEETVRVDELRPLSRSRYCTSECDKYAVIYKFSKIYAVRMKYRTYEKLKGRTNPQLHIKGHKGIFGRTIERAKVPD